MAGLVGDGRGARGTNMQLVWLPSAISDLQRLHDFLLPHNAVAAQRLVSLVKHAVHLLQTSPQIGKMADNLQDFRDIVSLLELLDTCCVTGYIAIAFL